MTNPAYDLGLRRLSQLTPTTEGSSALSLDSWPDLVPRETPALTLVPLPVRSPHGDTPTGEPHRDVDEGPDREGKAVHQQAHHLAQALVEIITGDRPLTQLVRWTTAEVYEQMHHRVRTLATCPVPLTTPSAPGRRHRPRVATVRVSRPAEGVAEVAARVDHGPRSTAVALRLERRVGARRVVTGSVASHVAESRWVCTAITWA